MDEKRILKQHQLVAEEYKIIKSLDYYETSMHTDIRSTMPQSILDAIEEVHPEITKRMLGISVNSIESIDGISVVDLGCGSGKDAFMMSKLVGPQGKVFGVDLSEERIEVCKQYIQHHTEAYHYNEPNVDFDVSYVEDVKNCGVKINSVDLVTTNGVICLCPKPSLVYQAAYDILKDGGEMFFTEVYANKPPNKLIYENPTYLAHGLAGQDWKTFLKNVADIGFTYPRLQNLSPIYVKDEWKKDTESHEFTAATYRMFKLPKINNPSNMLVRYRGGLKDYETKWRVDYNTIFEANKSVVVDAELGSILKYSRFSKYFDIETSNQPTDISPPDINPFEYAQLHKDYFKDFDYKETKNDSAQG